MASTFAASSLALARGSAWMAPSLHALSDGRVFHMEWVDPDGTRRTSPQMAYDWKRLTHHGKQHVIDSIQPLLEKQLASMKPRTAVLSATGGWAILTNTQGTMPNLWTTIERVKIK